MKFYGVWWVFLLPWPNVPMAPQCFMKEKKINMLEAKQANTLPKLAAIALIVHCSVPGTLSLSMEAYPHYKPLRGV